MFANNDNDNPEKTQGNNHGTNIQNTNLFECVKKLQCQNAKNLRKRLELFYIFCEPNSSQ